MHVALIGATGLVGSKLLDEMLARGHVVTGIVRDVGNVTLVENLKAVSCDILDTPTLAGAIHGHDCVVGAFSGKAESDPYESYIAGFRSVVKATKLAGVVLESWSRGCFPGLLCSH